MLVVPGFGRVLLQVNAPAWEHGGVFLLLFSLSVFMEFLHRWYFIREALRVTCPGTLWHLPWSCTAAAWEALPAHRQDLLLAKVTLLVREVIWKRGLSPF